jgi:hypothetical protein
LNGAVRYSNSSFMTQLLAGRLVSQSLPSVKCSTCGRPVPVDELGDHSCQPPPQRPQQQQQQRTPKSAAALLPPRLQNLAVNSPISPGPRSPVVQVSSPLRSAPVIQAPPRNNSPRPKSPLPPPPPSQTPVSAVQQHPHRPIPPQQLQRVDPRYERPPPPPDDNRGTRPTYDRNASSPRPNEIDTKSGGEAGMAGVGRRGFAAAARAALFTAPPPQHNQPPSINHIPGMDGRRANAPMYLDIDASRCK